jgi:hypothetical protein
MIARHRGPCVIASRSSPCADVPSVEAAKGPEFLRHRRAVGASTHPIYWAGFVAAGDWR